MKITLYFLPSHFFFMSKKSRQNLKYRKNEKSFQDEIKTFFIIFMELSLKQIKEHFFEIWESNFKVMKLLTSGKLLMFAKVSFAGFIYEVIKCFLFSRWKVQNLYEQNKIIKCFRYLLLKDTDSASLQIIFVCHKECSILKEETRKLIFKIAASGSFSQLFWHVSS